MENKKMSMTHGHSNHYRKLLIMAVLSYISMYVLMYAMVDTWGNVIPNINQFYMAALMTASMIVIELAVMGGMYANKKLNAVIIAGSLVVLAGSYICIRQQAAVSDREFLKSMIPHHAGAILMSEKAPSNDPEIKTLQAKIIESQRVEIAQMKVKLSQLDK
ncbi:MAG: DUF305 domain-containing protein [Daejeonella sp.]|uniref:DUF305 domain-containing protein n=1 Tax=Daejeonella sp. JGW-45 TaxID=3034148 RepID=UPI0023ECC987|nr:DUF305 domain-containing protein [Daejeonella sp. JGW-45]